MRKVFAFFPLEILPLVIFISSADQSFFCTCEEIGNKVGSSALIERKVAFMGWKKGKRYKTNRICTFIYGRQKLILDKDAHVQVKSLGKSNGGFPNFYSTNPQPYMSVQALVGNYL